jgi:hypothetical protein
MHSIQFSDSDSDSGLIDFNKYKPIEEESNRKLVRNNEKTIVEVKQIDEKAIQNRLKQKQKFLNYFSAKTIKNPSQVLKSNNNMVNQQQLSLKQPSAPTYDHNANYLKQNLNIQSPLTKRSILNNDNQMNLNLYSNISKQVEPKKPEFKIHANTHSSIKPQVTNKTNFIKPQKLKLNPTEGHNMKFIQIDSELKKEQLVERLSELYALRLIDQNLRDGLFTPLVDPMVDYKPTKKRARKAKNNDPDYIEY